MVLSDFLSLMENVDTDLSSIPDDLHKEFARIFEKFSYTAPSEEKEDKNPLEESALVVANNQDGESNVELVQAEHKISKRKLKEATRMTVAELKQKVSRPELVELQDVTARDPIFLLQLKSSKNSVPVPRHWSSKRRYLQGKRGYEKPPFQLPEFIRHTGIMEMRESVQEKDTGKSLKARTRERVQPKIGKIQLDYQQLHDAFFKWQTRPKLSIHGDLYYEGKEFEKKFRKRPGELSDELRTALGMPIGPNAHRYPPPWLTAMKRHGQPPSYPNLRIPGLNCPFEDNADEDLGEDAMET